MLERDLLLSETDAFYFGSVADVAVASDGRMYVLDGEASHVKMLSPEGRLQRTIGREGEGPGEFQWAREIVVGRGDSLYVLDAERDWISVFAPSGVLAYGIQAASEGELPDGLLVPRERAGFLLLYEVLPPPDTEREGTFTVRRIDVSARPADTVLTAHTRDRFPIETGRVRVYMDVPYGRGPHLTLGPEDALLFGRNDSLRFTRYRLDGTPLTRMSVPFESIPVTPAERTAELEDASGKYRTILDNRMPSTKPAFEQFLVDDAGRYWFGRPTAHADTTAWWVVDPEEKTVATARVSDEVNLEAVRNGYAYGETATKSGAPALVRYRVRLPSN